MSVIRLYFSILGGIMAENFVILWGEGLVLSLVTSVLCFHINDDKVSQRAVGPEEVNLAGRAHRGPHHVREILAGMWLVHFPSSLRCLCLFLWATHTHTYTHAHTPHMHTNMPKHTESFHIKIFPLIRQYFPECFKWAGMNFINR